LKEPKTGRLSTPVPSMLFDQARVRGDDDSDA